MASYEQILKQIQSDQRYQINLDWGKPRAGHTEGSIRQHIHELDTNLDRLKPRLSDDEFWKLRVLVHTHDTFKPNAKPGVSISAPSSHASLARQFLSSFVDDEELLEIVQYHDEPFALWRKSRFGGDYTLRMDRLLSIICDWDLFLTFLIIDGCTVGKTTEPLDWFFVEIDGRIESRVNQDWLNFLRTKNTVMSLRKYE